MQRPKIVTLFGILNMLIAIVVLLSLFSSLATNSLFNNNSHDYPPQLIDQLPQVRFWFWFWTILTFLAFAPLFVAGIGLLRLKSWGRLFCLIWAFFVIGMVVLFRSVGIFILPDPLPGTLDFGLIPGVCLCLIYPILLLLCLLRPKITTAFALTKTHPTDA